MLNSKKKEFLYALSGFGPGLIMVMLMAYFTTSVDARNLNIGAELWSWAPRGFALVLTAVPGLTFGILFTIGRVFDAVIDIPIASWIDRSKNRYRRIRLPILIGLLPMIAGALLMAFPIFRDATTITNAQLWGNSMYFFVASILFFAFYTLSVVAFLGSLATICKDRAQRTRVAYFRAFIDTVMYAMAYALAPLIINALDINIMILTAALTPVMLTILIPVFMTMTKSAKAALKAPVLLNEELLEKEKSQTVQVEPETIDSVVLVSSSEAAAVPSVAASGGATITAEEADKREQKIGIFKSIAFVFKSKAFWPWVIVGFLYMIGLQLFLASQNDLISGVLHLPPALAAALNSAAFGPVPIMLLLFNKILKRRGLRFAFQISLIAFGLGIAFFSLGSAYFFPLATMPRIIINLIGATISSFGIGILFIMPMMVASHTAAVEKKVTKRNNAAMYFAGQGIVFGIAGAIAGGVLWQNGLKGLGYIDGYQGGFLPDGTNFCPVGCPYYYYEFCRAGTLLPTGVVPLGGFIAPFVVFLFALAAFGVSFLMPKRYDAKTIGKIFDKNYVPDAEDLRDAEIAGGFNDKFKHNRGYDMLNGKLALSIFLAFIPGVSMVLGAITRFKRKQIIFGILSIVLNPLFYIADILSLCIDKRIDWLAFDTPPPKNIFKDEVAVEQVQEA